MMLTMIEFKGSHSERDVILWGIRWYMAFPISYLQLEEMMEERGVAVEHATLNRWVLGSLPLLERHLGRASVAGAKPRADRIFGVPPTRSGTIRSGHVPARRSREYSSR
jgi:putative transposase